MNIFKKDKLKKLKKTLNTMCNEEERSSETIHGSQAEKFYGTSRMIES